ncbi:MAG: lysoplasmalogenase [Cellulomonadaceae bacterium]|jgi:hypothetical protein|nr:lysoplasmalogenase [Cellulomonadaceae bacterium]
MYWLIPAILLPLLGLALYVPRRAAGRMRSALLIKCALSVGFIMYALAAAVRSTQVGELLPWTVGIMLFTTAGMVFGLLGDIWLDLKDIHLDYQQFYMFCGFSCFGICHLIFVVGMLRHYALPRWALPVAIAVGLLVAAFNIVTERPMRMDFGPYRWIVVAYSFVIGVATVLPLAYAIDIRNIPGHSWQPAVFAIGMLLFLASDLVLSQIYFQTDREKGNRTINYILNYLFYFGGQYTLALSLFFLPIPGSPLQ